MVVGRKSSARRFVALLLLAVATLVNGGCIGHLMGWASSEVDRTRRVLAELEAKNATLVEENLRLKEEVDSLRGKKKQEIAEPHQLDTVSR